MANQARDDGLMYPSQKTVFGAYDNRATFAPWYDKDLRFVIQMMEVAPHVEQQDNRRFVVQFECKNETILRVCQFDAEELLNLSTSEHFANIARGMEQQWQEMVGRPKQISRLTKIS